MENLNSNCICCYTQYESKSKYTYCWKCSKLPIKQNKCNGITKNKTQCKLKAISTNNNLCFFHKPKQEKPQYNFI
jgi:hypothetical protein